MQATTSPTTPPILVWRVCCRARAAAQLLERLAHLPYPPRVAVTLGEEQLNVYIEPSHCESAFARVLVEAQAEALYNRPLPPLRWYASRIPDDDPSEWRAPCAS